jgi:hypothetical protein
MAGAPTTKVPPLRNHIAMNEELEVKYWTKHLGVSQPRRTPTSRR